MVSSILNKFQEVRSGSWWWRGRKSGGIGWQIQVINFPAICQPEPGGMLFRGSAASNPCSFNLKQVSESTHKIWLVEDEKPWERSLLHALSVPVPAPAPCQKWLIPAIPEMFLDGFNPRFISSILTVEIWAESKGLDRSWLLLVPWSPSDG